MFLKYVQIVNYKNLKSSKFEFDKGTNTIIGENDAGKSNSMTAVRILLDSNYFYNTKRLKETDFSNALGDWRGHWIIISAFFDEISSDDKTIEVCSEICPITENRDFLKSYVRCTDKDFGTVTLFIRPIRKIRKWLAEASDKEDFEKRRKQINLLDYEFVYTSRSQADFVRDDIYKSIVGDFDNGIYADPDEDDTGILGSKIDILDVWQHLSVVYIDALRDVKNELRKPKNPLRRIFDTIQNQIKDEDFDTIRAKIRELNNSITGVHQVTNIGSNISNKLNEIVGLVYSPDITVESRLKDDAVSIAKHLVISPTSQDDIDLLGLGHLNILYIALKLVEFEYSKERELLNIMIVEEPEAHIHTHIQKTLFDNLKVMKDYTQVILTTHSTQISEVSDICKVNILKMDDYITTVMKPSRGLDEFGENILKLKNISMTKCLERYLDAKRSVLLFSKGVVLVEGDGEEILLPTLVKKSFGVSLDELGIGIVNIGNVAFENIACIFDEERLQRYCSIVTDLDAVLVGAEKCKDEAAKRGKSRKERVDRLFNDNCWVKSFYAPFTLEVDFAFEDANRKYIKQIVELCYTDEETIEKHKKFIDGTAAERYDSVLTVAQRQGKGWYATLLASLVGKDVVIPDYLLRAIVHASQSVVTADVIWKIAKYRFENKKTESIYWEQSQKQGLTMEEKKELVLDFLKEYPNDAGSVFIKYFEAFI
ncbi:MAG: AAA family ATPase [Phascolarctobacterium sp.]|nr:AAA family ATPase [Phascolarctobacterium sp.]